MRLEDNFGTWHFYETRHFLTADAAEIANAYTSALHLDHDENDTYFGLSEARFTEIIKSRRLV